jgi:hypothetical protein
VNSLFFLSFHPFSLCSRPSRSSPPPPTPSQRTLVSLRPPLSLPKSPSSCSPSLSPPALAVPRKERERQRERERRKTSLQQSCCRWSTRRTSRSKGVSSLGFIPLKRAKNETHKKSSPQRISISPGGPFFPVPFLKKKQKKPLFTFEAIAKKRNQLRFGAQLPKA